MLWVGESVSEKLLGIHGPKVKITFGH